MTCCCLQTALQHKQCGGDESVKMGVATGEEGLGYGATGYNHHTAYSCVHRS